MNMEELDDFCYEIKEIGTFDDAIDELADVMRENGESINDLDWLAKDTFYVDFVYDYLVANIKDFEKQLNDYFVKNTIKKQVG